MEISGYTYFEMKPGDKVFMPVHWLKIVIPCTVVAVEDVFNYPLISASIWRYRDIDGSVTISVPTKETNKETGWPVWREGTQEDLEGLNQCSQFLCVDEPVGHSLLLGDDVFLSLDEARARIPASNKRRLKVRLNRYRNLSDRFIESTWERAGEKYPGFETGFEKLPAKKIYVRRN